MGRRIYIHEQSLSWLARSSLDAAEQVEATMANTAVLKLLHHHLNEVGVSLGLVSQADAIEVESRLRQRLGGDMTRLLHAVGHRWRSPQLRGRFDAVLLPDDSVVASCKESGYLTFATDAKSGRRMYDDHVRLGYLWTEFVEGRADPDLTIIKGRSLAFIRPELPIGAGAGERYDAHIRTSALTVADLAGVAASKAHAAARVASEVLSDSHSVERIDAQLRKDVVSAMDRMGRRQWPPSTDDGFGLACAVNQ